MSDYEATAYLSLEKLKVNNVNNGMIGKAHVRILTVLRKNKKGTQIKNEILKRPYRTERQGSQISKNEKV